MSNAFEEIHKNQEWLTIYRQKLASNHDAMLVNLAHLEGHQAEIDRLLSKVEELLNPQSQKETTDEKAQTAQGDNFKDGTFLGYDIVKTQEKPS